MKKKKIIEIEEADMKKLNIQAANKGTHLKGYIETTLTKLANKKLPISK